MPLAVDVSNYSGPIDATQALALKAAGVERVIVQLVNPDITVHRDQFPALVAAALEVEAYVYLWFGSDIAARIRWAIGELAQRPAVKRVWLDCEDTGYQNGQDVATVLAGIRTAKALLEASGYAVGIYTAAWWWEPATGSSTEFSDLPLWDAHYDGAQTVGDPAYGGWTQQTMKQYQSDATLGNVPNVDLDWYEEDEVVTKLENNDAIAAFLETVKGMSPEIAQQDGQYIGTLSGAPAGYTDYVIRVKEA